MDRLTLMATFVKAVELGSFSAVADELNLSPQMVGKQVKMLEQHLGVSLLNRTTRQFSMTEAGHTYYRTASDILKEIGQGLAGHDFLDESHRAALVDGVAALATSLKAPALTKGRKKK